MKIAETVKVRMKPDYVFDVDGQPFPWFIADAGPEIARISDELYQITISIYCIAIPNVAGVLGFSTAGHDGHVPVIGGVEFPWMITADGYTFTAGSKVLPTVKLSFLAMSLDVDEDELYVDDRRKVFNVDGEMVG